MGFKDFLTEASDKREKTTIENFRKKVAEKLDSVAGNETKERNFGKSIFKEIHKKYYEFQDYLFDTITDNTARQLVSAKSWAALEGASEFFKSIGNERLANSFQKDADEIDKTSTTSTGAKEKAEDVIAAVKRKLSTIGDFVVNSPFDEITFPSTQPSTISVKESVKVAAANLYYQHKTKYFKRVSTITSKVELIVYVGGPKDGEIQHVIYDDNGVTKITTYGAHGLIDDALEGTFNSRTITKI